MIITTQEVIVKLFSLETEISSIRDMLEKQADMSNYSVVTWLSAAKENLQNCREIMIKRSKP